MAGRLGTHPVEPSLARSNLDEGAGLRRRRLSVS